MKKLLLYPEQQRKSIPANIPACQIAVDSRQWIGVTEAMHEAGAVFLSLWGANDRDCDGCLRLYAAYLLSDTLLVASLAIRDYTVPAAPSIAPWFPAALRMQRAAADLLGISFDEEDARGWLRHDGWPESVYPLRWNADRAQEYPLLPQPYPFVRVDGDGVHEIAVGPVHAGTIEPGHFRFSVVGEKVLRLEERLGYTHKGVAKLFQGMPQRDGHRLAARVSGDSAVAFSWAYCSALESLTETVCPARAVALRALALEHERLANHLGDLGALGNDAGFAFGMTQFSRLKEELLRVNVKAFGARYLLDYVLPGGVAFDLTGHGRGQLLREYIPLERGVASMRSIYNEHAGLQDRFCEAGRLETSLAQKLGAVGLAARASGIRLDLRVDHPWPPYNTLATNLAVENGGDVAARVQVRFDEILESLRLCRALLYGIPGGPIYQYVPPAAPELLGIGLIEGWRGPVMIAIETAEHDAIRRCHAHDPSWQNWPLLEYVIPSNIVPDFPLINKSFNLSYSGHDG